MRDRPQLVVERPVAEPAPEEVAPERVLGQRAFDHQLRAVPHSRPGVTRRLRSCSERATR